MAQNLHIVSASVSNLFTPEILEILESVLTPIESASEGDIVGISVGATSDEDGMVNLSPLTELIVKHGDKFLTRSWSFLEKDHPKRTDLAVAFAELTGGPLDRCDLMSLTQAMQTYEDAEHYSLGLFLDGAYFARCDVQENFIEPLSWDDDELEQSTIDSCFALVIPDFESEHHRLQCTKSLQSIQKAMLDIYPVVWNETDPVHFDFNLSPEE